MPLIASAPYNAEEAPGRSSTLFTSNSFNPRILPTPKLNTGNWLFIPSTRVTKPSL